MYNYAIVGTTADKGAFVCVLVRNGPCQHRICNCPNIRQANRQSLSRKTRAFAPQMLVSRANPDFACIVATD